MPRIALTVHPDDNVATLLDVRVEDRVTQAGLVLTADVPFGHKVALRPIPEGAAIVKYGVPIGAATTAIAAGDHVHVHNCR